jgi:hypothetical protein
MFLTIPSLKNPFLFLCFLIACKLFVGFAYQGKDIAFRFIIEYTSLRDFGP